MHWYAGPQFVVHCFSSVVTRLIAFRAPVPKSELSSSNPPSAVAVMRLRVKWSLQPCLGGAVEHGPSSAGCIPRCGLPFFLNTWWWPLPRESLEAPPPPGRRP